MIGTEKQVAYAHDMITKTNGFGSKAIAEARAKVEAAEVSDDIKARFNAVIDQIADHAVFYIIEADANHVLHAVNCFLTGEKAEYSNARRIIEDILAKGADK